MLSLHTRVSSPQLSIPNLQQPHKDQQTEARGHTAKEWRSQVLNQRSDSRSRDINSEAQFYEAPSPTSQQLPLPIPLRSCRSSFLISLQEAKIPIWGGPQTDFRERRDPASLESHGETNCPVLPALWDSTSASRLSRGSGPRTPLPPWVPCCRAGCRQF